MRIHCTVLAAGVLAAAAGAATAQTVEPQPGDAAFSIFVRNTQLGREQVTLSRTDSGWLITSSGTIGSPVDLTLNRFEMKYSRGWAPEEMKLDARVRVTPVVVSTSFSMTSAINEITQGDRGAGKTDQISARTVVIPNNVYGAYEALAAQIWDDAPGTELHLYVVPNYEIKATVRSAADQTLTGPAGSIGIRRFELTLQNPTGNANGVIVVDTHRRLVRFELPDIGLQVVREDASSVAMRTQIARNPTDADVSIPANGFQLAATMTTPQTIAGRLHYPAVVLIGGATPADRDEVIGGVPIFTQLARGLADSGHIVLRYDRRGSGQSGGRTESVTLTDYAEDAIAVVKWISKQNEVDTRHIIVAGYADGAAVALLAASKEKKINGVVTLEASGTLGADLLLAQQERALEATKLSASDRESRIELQKKIQAAVISGKGWEAIPEPLRRQADTPFFKSVLTYNPADVLKKVGQPILILHADLDPNVPSTEADRLGEIAKSRKKDGATSVVHIADVTNTLADPNTKVISEKVVTAIVEWIRKR